MPQFRSRFLHCAYINSSSPGAVENDGKCKGLQGHTTYNDIHTMMFASVYNEWYGVMHCLTCSPFLTQARSSIFVLALQTVNTGSIAWNRCPPLTTCIISSWCIMILIWYVRWFDYDSLVVLLWLSDNRRIVNDLIVPIQESAKASRFMIDSNAASPAHDCMQSQAREQRGQKRRLPNSFATRAEWEVKTSAKA